MARGNFRRRALIAELGLQGQAESISTKSLLALKEERDIAALLAKPRRRARKTVAE